MGANQTRTIATRILWVVLPVLVVTLSVRALQSSHRQPARAKPAVPTAIRTDVGEVVTVGTSRHVPGYAYCDPMTATATASCEHIVVSVPLLDELLGKAPSGAGLPPCPTGSPDPGFRSPDPPACVADPHFAVTHLFLNPADKARFLRTYHCLGTFESPCDVKHAAS